MSATAALSLPSLPDAKPASVANLRINPNPADKRCRKILVLEDDQAFRDIMHCYFTDQGLSVVTVQNGVEGVHEVLAGDFDAILCDMQMPTLPGDMFYRAVERMRPHLCERFIFMTGYRGNQKINEFINSVNGMVLIKPFHMDEIQEMLAFVELRELLLAA
ncbi:MAG: response regulator [Chthoniobacteraceae bacterium]